MTDKNEKTVDGQTGETEVGFLRGLLKSIYTAKDVGAVTQPVNQVPYTPNVDAEDFIKSTIEFNKAMPQQTKLMEKMIENQQQQIDAMAGLTTEISQMKISLSEQNSKIQGLDDQIQIIKAGDGETEIKDTITNNEENPSEEEAGTTEEEVEVGGTETGANNEQETEEDKETEASEKAGTENSTGNDKNTEDKPAGTDEEEEEEEEEPPRAPHTAKDAFHRVGSNNGTGIDSRKQMLTFLSKRGYNNFLEQ